MLIDGGVLQDGMTFDGTNHYFVSSIDPPVAGSGDDFTFLTVSKLSSSGSGSRGLMSGIDNFNDGAEVFVDSSNGYSFRIDNTDLDDGTASTTTKDLVIASYDPDLSSNEQKLRVNRTLYQQNCTETLAVTVRHMAIGKRHTGDTRYEWHGSIYESILWDHALSDDAVTVAQNHTMYYHGIG